MLLETTENMVFRFISNMLELKETVTKLEYIFNL